MSVNLKREAAAAALSLVEPGMKLGIGTGSTAEEFIHLLGDKVASGMQIVGVPTSERTATLCHKLAIPLTTLDETPQLDLTIDGADELDGELQLIKGGGGALLREKIVACASERMVVIADESKVVDRLGEFPLPVEINKFGQSVTVSAVSKVVADQIGHRKVEIRKQSGQAFETDGGHLILDVHCETIPDVKDLSDRLLSIPGVVQHGLFVDIAKDAFVAGGKGITHLTRGN